MDRVYDLSSKDEDGNPVEVFPILDYDAWRFHRNASGKLQIQIAKEIGMSEQTVTAHVKGDTAQMSTLIKMAVAIKQPVGHFVRFVNASGEVWADDVVLPESIDEVLGRMRPWDSLLRRMNAEAESAAE